MATMEARSPAQRDDALALANRIRSYRAKLKRDIRTGRRTARGVLLRPPYEVETMKVRALLMAQDRWGERRADQLLRRAGVSSAKTIGGLSERQRREIASDLR